MPMKAVDAFCVSRRPQMRYTSGHLALGQRPPLSGRLRLNHHRVVLGNALQDGISGDLIGRNPPAWAFIPHGHNVELSSRVRYYKIITKRI